MQKKRNRIAITGFLRFYFADSDRYEFSSDNLIAKLEALDGVDGFYVKIRADKGVEISYFAGRGMRHNIQQYFYGTISEDGQKLSGTVRMDPGVRFFFLGLFSLMTIGSVFGESPDSVGDSIVGGIILFVILFLILGGAYLIGMKDESIIISMLTALLGPNNEKIGEADVDH